MILESLRVLLFGMIGIFIVMGVIIGFTHLLGKVIKDGGEEEAD